MAAVLLLLFSSSSAFAQEPGVSQSTSKARAGVQFELLPTGKLVFDGGGFDGSADTAVAYGFAGNFDYDLLPWLSVGFAPRFVFNVIGSDEPSGSEAHRQLDLRARVAASTMLADKLRAYGFLAPGWSFVLAPDRDRLGSANGFALGFGGGVSYDLTPALYLAGEIGYQIGFQTVQDGSLTIVARTEFLSVGLGAGKRF